MRFMMQFVLLLSLASARPLLAASAEAAADARAFFARYVELGASFDPDVADLYADDAVVKTHRLSGDGSASDQQMSGAQWKLAIRQLMPAAKERGDVSEYSHIEVRPDGDRATISAHRYSVAKCYTDSTYVMIVKRQDGGPYRIVEEYSVTQAKSDCKPSQKQLAASLAEATRQLAGRLPLAVDDDTRLDAVTVVGQNALRYEYTLVNYAAADLDVASLRATLQEIVRGQTCGTPQLRRLLDLGATVSYLYRGNDGRDVCQLDIRNGDCP